MTTQVGTDMAPVLSGEVEYVEPSSEREREIARCLAIGYSWDETAKVAGVSRRTVARRANKLAPIVAHLRAGLPDILEGAIVQNLHLALEIERRMLTGDILPSDARYKEAKEIVKRVVERLFYVDKRPAALGAPPVPPPPAGLLPDPADGQSRIP